MQPAFVDDTVGYMKAYSKKLSISLDYFANRVRDMVLPNISRLLECFRYFSLSWRRQYSASPSSKNF